MATQRITFPLDATMPIPPRYSIIVPVYNRPEEVEELLQSLAVQTLKTFEVIIVEDGSSRPCLTEVERYQGQLSIQYHATPNGGPSKARNIGSQWAEGEYIVLLDSDIILPPQYIASIEQALNSYRDKGAPLDAFGGPDAAHADFTTVQKAINYSMTSFLTTGGIRGGKKRISHYYPRSFNLGCRTALYREMGGFDPSMRYGEDLDFSMRLHQRGAHVQLIPEAFVYHKRRSTFLQFFRQVFKFGGARVALSRRHPHSLRPIHLLPSVATLFLILFFVGGVCTFWSWFPIGGLAFLFFFDALVRTRSIKVAGYAVIASFTQIFGYGLGLIRALFDRKT
ncbi:glycosyltransferase involved in cell wall biosynthesis [Porphyromonas circumdentaria]|nr:glycosyltransferase involved in cell wall biosynthesis [Porphyromonas circumdentaria]